MIEQAQENQSQATAQTQTKSEYTDAYVKSLREEAQKANHVAKEAAEKLSAMQKAAEEEKAKASSESNDAFKKAQEEATKELKAKLESLEKATNVSRAKMVNSELKRISERMGAHDVDDVRLNINFDKIEITEDGEIKGMQEQIEELKKNKNHLFGKTSTSVPAQAPYNSGDEKRPTAYDIPKDEWRELCKQIRNI